MSHKQILIIRKDLNMRKGKIAAQAAHASMGAILSQMTREDNTMILDLTDERLSAWITGQFKKICVYVNTEQELIDIYEKAKENNLICSLIKDSGLTEFNGVPTLTAAAIGPDFDEKIDAVCKHLPLF